MAFRRRNAWRFVAIYKRGDLYLKRTRSFMGFLGPAGHNVYLFHHEGLSEAIILVPSKTVLAGQLLAFVDRLLNRQRRMNGRMQRFDKCRRKCGIIVMVSHRIRSGQDTGWRQDN